MNRFWRLVGTLGAAMLVIIGGVAAAISWISNVVMAPQRLHDIRGELPAYVQLIIGLNPTWFLMFFVFVLGLLAWAIWPNLTALKQARETAAQFEELKQFTATQSEELRRQIAIWEQHLVTNDKDFRAEQSSLAQDYHQQLQAMHRNYEESVQSRLEGEVQFRVNALREELRGPISMVEFQLTRIENQLSQPK